MTGLQEQDKRSLVAPSAELDGKPVVLYKAVPTCDIVVGYPAMILPVNHYATNRVTNRNVAITTVVLSYDKATGDFETANTRYVLDVSYLH